MIPDFAHSIYQRFRDEGIPLLLAGGWAVCHHGYSRLTLDVDFICRRSDEGPAIQLMEQSGFQSISMGMANRFKHKTELAFPYVDLIWVDDSTFSKMEKPDTGHPRPPQIPTINLRALLAMKLHALKNHDQRQGRDLLDIRSLMAYSHVKIPEDEFKSLCDQFAGPDIYERLILPPQ